MLKKVLFSTTVITSIIATSAIAQQAGVKRTPLRTIDFPAGFTTVTTISELSSGCAGRHTHPGIESGYLIEGDLLLKIEGKPDLLLKAGDSFESPPNTPHDACTTSGFKSLSTYIVEKGKPLASPAP
jgi:Cupin domain